MNEKFLNDDEIRKAINLIKETSGNKIFEIRIIQGSGKKAYTIVGYFSNPETAINALHRQSLDGKNIYMVLNEINEDLYHRITRDTFKGGETSTSDKDIVCRDWLFIDIDADKISGISSTDEQVQIAYKKAKDVEQYLSNSGFESPVVAFSGNGYHLLYKIAMLNTDENTKLIDMFMKSLALMFTDTNIKIDTSVSNAARICKLYGTLAQKGADTQERPHRMSRIVEIPDEIKVTDVEYIRKIADIFPKEPEEPTQKNNYRADGADFSLDDWLNKYGINYRKDSDNDGVQYILDHCPFNPDHKGKDAVIYQYKSGGIGFNCFHNECRGRRWQDVRMLFEPDAYKKSYDDFKKKTYSDRNGERQVKMLPRHEEVHIVAEENEPIFENAEFIMNRTEVIQTYIPTGTAEIDRRMRGLAKGCTTLVSGLRGSGKSSLMSQWMLEAIDDGFNVGCFSGELTDSRFLRWMMQQAAGKSAVEYGGFEGVYNVPIATRQKIAKWMGNKFLLYNNKYGNNFHAIMEVTEKAIVEHKLDMMVFDNLMALDIGGDSRDKYNAQTKFVLDIVDMAHKYNVQCLFIAHPRKANGFIRLDDISGSADLSNAVDSAFIVHRNNNDFKRLSKDMFDWNDNDPVYDGDNVVEIVKDRESGNQDVFIPLYFEKETRRLKNEVAENRIYGWQKDRMGFLPINMEIEQSEIPFD